MAKRTVKRVVNRSRAVGIVSVNGVAETLDHERVEYADGTVKETGRPLAEVMRRVADAALAKPNRGQRKYQRPK